MIFRNPIRVLSYFYHTCVLSRYRRARLLVTPWTVAHQALLSMGFSRQKHWSGLACLPPGDLPDPGIELASAESPALADAFFTTEPLGSPSAADVIVAPICALVSLIYFLFFQVENGREPTKVQCHVHAPSMFLSLATGG